MEAEIRELRRDMNAFTQEMRALIDRLRPLVVVGQFRHCVGAGGEQMLVDARQLDENNGSDDEESTYLEAIEYPLEVNEEFDSDSLNSADYDDFQESTEEFSASATESESLTTSDILRDAIQRLQSSGDHNVDCEVKDEVDKNQCCQFREAADLRSFHPEDVEVFVQFRKVTVHAQHMETPGGANVFVQQFYRTYTLPDEVHPQTVTTEFNEAGYLVIEAPLQSPTDMESPGGLKHKSKF